MRLNGLAPSAYPIERPAQRGGAVVPYRESERAAEKVREMIVTPSSDADATYESLSPSKGIESTDYASVISGDFMPARFEAMMDRSLTSRATQALQSYSTTAAFTANVDAHEVLGLDLYA